MHIVYQLYDVLRFDPNVVINVLINISYLTSKQPNISKFSAWTCCWDDHNT